MRAGPSAGGRGVQPRGGARSRACAEIRRDGGEWTTTRGGDLDALAISSDFSLSFSVLLLPHFVPFFSHDTLLVLYCRCTGNSTHGVRARLERRQRGNLVFPEALPRIFKDFLSESLPHTVTQTARSYRSASSCHFAPPPAPRGARAGGGV